MEGSPGAEPVPSGARSPWECPLHSKCIPKFPPKGQEAQDQGWWGSRGMGAAGEDGGGTDWARDDQSQGHVLQLPCGVDPAPGQSAPRKREQKFVPLLVRLLSFQKDLPPFPGHFQPSQECRATRWQESGPCRLLEKSPLPPPRTATLSE